MFVKFRVVYKKEVNSFSPSFIFLDLSEFILDDILLLILEIISLSLEVAVSGLKLRVLHLHHFHLIHHLDTNLQNREKMVLTNECRHLKHCKSQLS